MTYHKVLEKQIRKHLPEKYLNDEAVSKFLSAINNAYNTFEKDKKISEHAFVISEKEYQEVTGDLRKQNEIKQQSISQLKDAIKSLDKDSNVDLDNSGDDLINIISFLQKQIVKTKELESELINARDFAENAARAKSDFLSVMSHEIRTPLNAIIGYIHLLQHESPMPNQLEFLRILQISADNLLSLINDVLDFAKIEEGKIIFAERDTDIRQLVTNIRLAYRIKAEEKGLGLKILFDDDIPPFVKADDVRLTQILNNLISNAIKFTAKGNVVIEVHMNKMTEDEVEILFAIKDSGVGISPEKQQLIFERFTQENSNITREYGGSGLGLAIIKKLLLLQNTDIYVESIPGKGSNFYFTLKFKRSNTLSKEEKKHIQEEENLLGINVLLVEDVEFNILLAQKLLSNWNAKVTVAENGLIGVEKMKAGDYDIVLMDLQMPIMDGFTSSLKIREFNQGTPIVAMTASTSMDIQQKVYECGINDYISKPLNPSNLYKTIVKHTLDKAL